MESLSSRAMEWAKSKEQSAMCNADKGGTAGFGHQRGGPERCRKARFAVKHAKPKPVRHFNQVGRPSVKRPHCNVSGGGLTKGT